MSPPSLVAIVNPLNGRCWNRAGKSVPNPLTNNDLIQIREITAGFENAGGIPDRPDNVSRILVFAQKDSTAMSADAPAMIYNRGFMPAVSSKKGYDFRLARVKRGERNLDVRVRYDVGPSRTLVEVAWKDGRFQVLKGAERHPRLLDVPEGLSLTARRTVEKDPYAYSGDGPGVAVVFDDYQDRSKVTDRTVLYDRQGTAYYNPQSKNIQDHGDRAEIFPVRLAQVGRYLCRRSGLSSYTIRKVAMHPSR